MNTVKKVFFSLLMSVVLAGSALADQFYDLKGNPVEFDHYLGKGKWTVLMIWASDCHVCNAEASKYEKMYQDAKEGELFTLVGLSMDGRQGMEAANEFVFEHQLTFPNLLAAPEAVASMFYQSTGQFFMGTPAFMVFNREGKLTAADFGAFPPNILIDHIQKNDKVQKSSVTE